MTELPAAAHRVQTVAAELRLPIAVRLMPASTRTAAEAAEACGCGPGQIVKSLIFRGKNSGHGYLLLVSGTNRVHEEHVGNLIGEPITRPDADFVRAVTGFAIGGVPPFGHDTVMAAYFDEDLLQYETVWAAAGTPTAVFSVDPAQLRAAIGARLIVVK